MWHVYSLQVVFLMLFIIYIRRISEASIFMWHLFQQHIDNRWSCATARGFETAATWRFGDSVDQLEGKWLEVGWSQIKYGSHGYIQISLLLG